MRLMFLRVLSWLGDHWRSMHLDRRRHHFNTLKFKASAWLTKCRQIFTRLKWRAALRVTVFWALMATAALIIYTEQVPLFTSSLGLRSDQGGWTPGAETAALYYQSDAPVRQLSALPETPLSPGDAAVSSVGMVDTGETVIRENAPAVQEDSVPSDAGTDLGDDAAAVLAGLPRFEVANILQPLQGKVIRSLGWYRHEVFGDWRMAPGLMIAPAGAGEPVLAAYTGVVDQVTKLEANTWSVKLMHQAGWETEYGGLAQVTVEPGGMVRQGEPLGVTADVESIVSFALKHQGEPVDTAAYWR
ncbi:MAG TPA: M23 family metallopeptidase [Firmicutes bacterium]|jgi:murein DD-endopeptidase MepM/ murein hydrolase activator NlpD|nr:M23 family metallopeptidase [Bacillota bacterium]